MSLAILKLSYNQIGDSTVIGGICGSAFFIDDTRVITANHVLSAASFKPNDGYKFAQFWLVSESGNTIELKKEFLSDYPNIDTTLITFPSLHLLPDFKPEHFICQSSDTLQIGEKCLCEGYIAGTMPSINHLVWMEGKIVLGNLDLTNNKSCAAGKIDSISIASINSKDINLKDVTVIKLTTGGVKGLSGSALRRESSGEIIGLMSFGLPADSDKKDILFAVSIEEVNKALGLSKHS